MRGIENGRRVQAAKEAFRREGYGTKIKDAGGCGGAWILHVWQRALPFTLLALVLAGALGYTAFRVATIAPFPQQDIWSTFAATVALLMVYSAWRPMRRATFTFWGGEPSVSARFQRFTAEMEEAEMLTLLRPHCVGLTIKCEGFTIRDAQAE